MLPETPHVLLSHQANSFVYDIGVFFLALAFCVDRMCALYIPDPVTSLTSADLRPTVHSIRSYTSFEYSRLRASHHNVNFTLRNIGERAGAEVVQVYLGFPSDAGEPPRQLKGFKKVMLAVGESLPVSIPLTERETSVWDVHTHAWKSWPGEYRLWVSSSSRDDRLVGSFTVVPAPG